MKLFRAIPRGVVLLVPDIGLVFAVIGAWFAILFTALSVLATSSSA